MYRQIDLLKTLDQHRKQYHLILMYNKIYMFHNHNYEFFFIDSYF